MASLLLVSLLFVIPTSFLNFYLYLVCIMNPTSFLNFYLYLVCIMNLVFNNKN